MRLLIIHQNFPGQFGFFTRAWAQRPGWDVRGIGRESTPGMPGFLQLTRYRLARQGNSRQHAYLRQMEEAILHGQAVARALIALRDGGFTPDAILAHPGWGETLYAKDVFPDARLIHYCEWFYSAKGADLGFDAEFPISFDDETRIRTWNALHLLNLANCDAAITPTRWQWSRHPVIFQPTITVQHEGIALDSLGPDSTAALKMPNGVFLKAGDPVITYVARNLEPYRGFHVFMRALEKIQRAHPACHAIIVGGDGVSYGKRPKNHANWREHMLKEVRLDPGRTHFVGRIPRPAYLKVLQVSAAHVYLNYPFVLSWSLVEAIACATKLIASETAPVCEFMSNGAGIGQLFNFFDVAGLTERVLGSLDQRRSMGVSNAEARRRALLPFDRHAALEAYDRLLA